MVTGPLVIATHNPGKLAELRVLLQRWPVMPIELASLSIPVPKETAPDYVGNATLKAEAARDGTGLPALGDDTGLEIPSLGGMPGVHSARFAAQLGGWPRALEWVGRATGADRGDVVEGVLVCALALARPHAPTLAVEARVHGHLRWPPNDAPGLAAILSPDDDANVSTDGVLLHRRRAFDALDAALAGA